MRSYVITANGNQETFRDVQSKGGADTYSFDLSPWVEDNASVSSATWTVESGQAAISGKTLSANVASALLTFSESGHSLIKLVATTATEKYVIWLDVVAKDYSEAPVEYSAYV